MSITFETTITSDGKITLPGEYRNLSSQKVIVVLITKHNDSKCPKATDLPFFGMWKDRTDMADSSKWVREKREQWHTRSYIKERVDDESD
jgi:hypothetical protein